MKYAIYSFALCLIAPTTFFAADTPITDAAAVNNTEKTVLILQNLQIELNQIATTDYSNSLNILQTIATTAHHSPDCTQQKVIIMGDKKNLDFIKDTFENTQKKYELIEISLCKATNQFLKLKEKERDMYTSNNTIFWTSLGGTTTMLESILNMKECDHNTAKKMLSLACMYGNVEVAEYLTQKIPITDMPNKQLPTILDILQGNVVFFEAKMQQELTTFKNVAITRLEYINHKNPDTQKIRKSCPFEECQRLVSAAINKEKITSGNQLHNNQSDNSTQKS